MQTKHGWLPDRNVDVAGPLLDAGHQELVDQNLLSHGFPAANENGDLKPAMSN